MDLENPYASPGAIRAPLESAADIDVPFGAVRRWRNDVIVPLDSQLPARCARCGEPASAKLRRAKVKWVTRWVTLPIAGVACISAYSFRAGWLAWWFVIGLSIAGSFILERRYGKRGHVYFRFCDLHERRTRRWSVIGHVTGGFAVVAIFTTLVLLRVMPTSKVPMSFVPIGTIATGIGAVIAAIAMAGMAQPFEVRRIRNGYVWLKNMDGRFVQWAPLANPQELELMEGTGDARQRNAAAL